MSLGMRVTGGIAVVGALATVVAFPRSRRAHAEVMPVNVDLVVTGST